jgi:hypothetical protein
MTNRSQGGEHGSVSHYQTEVEVLQSKKQQRRKGIGKTTKATTNIIQALFHKIILTAQKYNQLKVSINLNQSQIITTPGATELAQCKDHIKP